MTSPMPWQKIPKPPTFAPVAPKLPSVTSNAGGLTASQKISLAAGRRATRKAARVAFRGQQRAFRVHGQQVRQAIRSHNKTANAGYETRVRNRAAGMKARLAVARTSVNALPAKAKIAVTSSEAAVQNFSNKVRLVDPDYIDLGKDGSKWKHGFIPLNPAAVALKAHKTPGGGGTTKVHVGGKYVGNVRVLTGKRGRKTHVATAPIGPNATATHHASHAEAVAAIKARSGTHDPNLPAANNTGGYKAKFYPSSDQTEVTHSGKVIGYTTRSQGNPNVFEAKHTTQPAVKGYPGIQHPTISKHKTHGDAAQEIIARHHKEQSRIAKFKPKSAPKIKAPVSKLTTRSAREIGQQDRRAREKKTLDQRVADSFLAAHDKLRIAEKLRNTKPGTPEHAALRALLNRKK